MNQIVSVIKTKNWLYLIFFGILSISLLTPLGSILGTYDHLPNNDLRAHSALILQAKMAIDEGQIPIRVAPWQHEKLRYPEYQFYSFLPFTIAGYIYKAFSHFHSAILQNPFNTLKLVEWLAITIGGFFVFRFARLFTDSDILALLAAVAYTYSPYLSFNITLNGDFTEVCAQGLLPIALFYSFRLILFNKFNSTDFFFSTVAWFALLTSHLITFAYGLLFFSLAAGVLLLTDINKWKGFLWAIASTSYCWLLAAWYVFPVVKLSSYLAAASGMLEGVGLRPTSFFNLLAMKSQELGISPSYPGFYASIGWPFLFGFFACLYFIVWPKVSRKDSNYKLMLGITFLFIIALLMTWSWFNIWKFLPYYFSIGQFGHRFLAQIMWLGVILFVLAIENIFGKTLDAKHFVLGVFLICFAGSSWIVKPEDGIKVSQLLKTPEIYPGGHDYFIRADRLLPFPGLTEYGFIQLPLMTIDSKLILNNPISLTKNMTSQDIFIVLKGKVLSLASQDTLNIKLNNKIIASAKIKSGTQLDWKIPLGKLVAENNFNDAQALKLSLTLQNQKMPQNILPIQIEKFQIGSEKMKTLPLQNISNFCKQNKKNTECEIYVNSTVGVQLPVLYYPEILSVNLDGNKIPYQATYYQDPKKFNKNDHFDPSHDWLPIILTTVVLPEGKHLISIQNNGLLWANKISFVAWILLILFIFYKSFGIYRKKLQ